MPYLRSAVLRIASGLPTGDETRRALLAALQRNAAIKVRYEATDGYKETKRFTRLDKAQEYAESMVGERPEISQTFGYAVSQDGIGKVTVSGDAVIEDLFPSLKPDVRGEPVGHIPVKDFAAQAIRLVGEKPAEFKADGLSTKAVWRREFGSVRLTVYPAEENAWDAPGRKTHAFVSGERWKNTWLLDPKDAAEAVREELAELEAKDAEDMRRRVKALGTALARGVKAYAQVWSRAKPEDVGDEWTGAYIMYKSTPELRETLAAMPKAKELGGSRYSIPVGRYGVNFYEDTVGVEGVKQPFPAGRGGQVEMAASRAFAKELRKAIPSINVRPSY